MERSWAVEPRMIARPLMVVSEPRRIQIVDNTPKDNSKGDSAVTTQEASVSVIIPSFNSAGFLADAIGSVLRQTRPVQEIVVVDDGSSDDTVGVCARFGDTVRYIRQPNAGAATARNTGIRNSSGDWLAFLDADDLWEPHKIESQILALEQNPTAAFAVTASLVWSPGDREYQIYRWRGSLDPAVMQAELLVRNILTGLCSSLLVRREALLAVGGFAAGKLCEDRRLAIALLDRFQGVLLETPLIRQRPGPAHFSNPERHRQEMLSLIADHEELFQRLDPSGRLKRRAKARVYERSGMHYLENGDLRTAARDLRRAARLSPFLPNPWRVLINACLGRLRLPSRTATPLADLRTST